MAKAILVFRIGTARIVDLEEFELEMDWPVVQPPFGAPVMTRMRLIGDPKWTYGFYEEKGLGNTEWDS